MKINNKNNNNDASIKIPLTFERLRQVIVAEKRQHSGPTIIINFFFYINCDIAYQEIKNNNNHLDLEQRSITMEY